MPEERPTVGDAVLVEFDDGIKRRIRERSKTHATFDVEKRFDRRRHLTTVTDETRVVVLSKRSVSSDIGPLITEFGASDSHVADP